MSLPVMAAIVIVRNSIAAVAAALLPRAMFGLPAVRATSLPCTSLFAFLFMLLLLRTLQLCMLPPILLAPSLVGRLRALPVLVLL